MCHAALAEPRLSVTPLDRKRTQSVEAVCPSSEPGDLWEGAVHESSFFLSTVELQVTSETQTVTHLLGSSVSLHCSFSMAPGLDLTGVEWRLQHKGSGHLVYSWKTGQVQAMRKGASLEPEQLQAAGDASLTLPNLSLKDEGSYVCQITTSLYQAQQIILLNILGETGPCLFWGEGRGGACGSVLQPRTQTQWELPQPKHQLHPGGTGGIR